MTTTDPTESVRGAIRAARAGDPAPAINLDTLGPTDSELESPTPLAERIAREHLAHTVWADRCSCSCGASLPVLPFPANAQSTDVRAAHAAHIAAVTERAVGERVAEGIERLRDALTDDPDRAALELLIEDAARIARGEGA